MSEAWICRNIGQFEMFAKHIREGWDWSKPLSITWTDAIRKSTGQNNLCHKWFDVIAKHLNTLPGGEYTKDDIKDYLKKRFGMRKRFIDPLTGEEMQKLKSVGDYTKGEMTAFMREIEVFAADIGCVLPFWGEYESLRKCA